VAGFGALLNVVRSGGSGAIAAARELQNLSQAGQLTGAQAQQLDAAAASPELRDVFAAAQNYDALTGQTGRPVEVAQLASGAVNVGDTSELASRFFTDANIFRAELNGKTVPGSSEQAQRLLQFFEPYAERFVDARPSLPEAQAAKLETQFTRALTQLGFSELRTSDGRTGLDAAKDMLRAADGAGVRAAKPELVAPQIALPQTRVTQARIDETPDSKPGDHKKKQRDGVLGSNMLWNVMHLMRGDELDDVAKKDAMNQLMVSAFLLLVFGGIVALVLLVVR